MGNENAVKHGFYRRPARPLVTIDDAQEHLAECLVQLADYIRDNIDSLSADEIARLEAVRGQNLSRYVRILRDRAAMTGGLHEQRAADVDQALEIVSEVLGAELSSR
jgi:hypothetical protein